MATQLDVARAAGVSQATVSMVLTGTADAGRISLDTRDRVLAAAKKLHYSPRPTPAGPARPRPGSPYLLGVHTFEPIFPTSARDYYFEFLQGIEEQAGAEGCNLMLFTAGQDGDGGRRIYGDSGNRLAQAAGSLLLGHHANRADLTRLVQDGYPFVYIGHRELPGVELNYVGGDYRTGTGRIVDELVALGHRRFGYLGEPVRDEPQEDRWSGFAAALDRFGLAVPEPAYVHPAELTAAWLDRTLADGATAILVESAGLVRVLAAMAKLRGLRIPEDLSVVLLVDDPDEGTRPIRWATLKVARNAMGRRAVRLLTALLADPDGEYERQLLLPCDHDLGDTVGPPPAGGR